LSRCSAPSRSARCCSPSSLPWAGYAAAATPARLPQRPPWAWPLRPRQPPASRWAATPAAPQQPPCSSRRHRAGARLCEQRPRTTLDASHSSLLSHLRAAARCFWILGLGFVCPVPPSSASTPSHAVGPVWGAHAPAKLCFLPQRLNSALRRRCPNQGLPTNCSFRDSLPRARRTTGSVCPNPARAAAPSADDSSQARPLKTTTQPPTAQLTALRPSPCTAGAMRPCTLPTGTQVMPEQAQSPLVA
jgi:hypothetical protein